MASFALLNARLVLPQQVAHGCVHVVEGRIASVNDNVPASAAALDCQGDFILPGLVELHTDNLEHHLEPRPGTFRTPERAILAHDAELASAGITTAFDAVTLGGDLGSETRDAAYLESIDRISSAAAEGLLRISHLIHLRCELSDERLGERLTAATAKRIPQLVSLMDHTPGQGQWEDIERFRAYYARRYGLSPTQIDELIGRRQLAHARHAQPNRTLILQFAHEHRCVLASHDVATETEAVNAERERCAMVEFPTSLSAARRARQLRLAIVAGAPNLVRGSSHSGNVSAATLASEGLIDVLSSDYCPPTLLEGVFRLAEGHGVPLHEAAATASANPARLLGLNDRGSIARGLRADLIRARETSRGPVLISAWCAGRQVA